MAAIVVLGLWLQNEGNLRALALVRVFKTTVDDYRVVQQEGQKPFVQPPQKVRFVDGREVFRGPIVGFPADITAAVETAVLDAYHAQLRKCDGDTTGYKNRAYSTGDIPGYQEPKTGGGLTQGIDGATPAPVVAVVPEKPKGETARASDEVAASHPCEVAQAKSARTGSQISANAENEAPTKAQVGYLSGLGYKGPMPANKAVASQMIERLKNEKAERFHASVEGEAEARRAQPSMGI